MRKVVAVVAVGCVLGFGVGAWYGKRVAMIEVAALFDLPEGEFYATSDPSAVWQKTGPRQLAYRPLPTSSQVQIMKLFQSRPVEQSPTPNAPPPQAPMGPAPN
jgi:hypothetical protein